MRKKKNNYNELTDEEINYQLDMSDQYEFSYNYAKYLQQKLNKYKAKEKELREYIKKYNIIEAFDDIDEDDNHYFDCMFSNEELYYNQLKDYEKYERNDLINEIKVLRKDILDILDKE
jgi:hypothetical protein